MKKFTQLFILLIFLSNLTEIKGQGLKGNNWYFGNSENGIRFNKSDKEPSLVKNQAIPFGTGGSAVATDPVTGDLLFYTDGQRVYDASHRLMSDGDNLGGNAISNQSVAVFPVPGEDGKYYIFSNNPGSNIIANVVDMNLPGNATSEQLNLGAIDPDSKQVFSGVFSTSTAMAIIKGTTPGIYYLLLQDNDNLRSFDLSVIPPSTPINSQFDPNITAGAFVYNEINHQLAIVPAEENQNIKIYQFDPSNGSFSIKDTIQNSAKAGEQLYDAAWSSDGEKLFFSRCSTGDDLTGQVYQYYADSVAPQPVLPNPVYRSYGLQTGPDGRLYHLYQEENNTGPFLLGRLENPDSIENYNYTSWQQDVNFSGTQFPQFTPQEDFLFELVEFEVIDTCANSRTKFIPHVLPAYDSLIWIIADTTINAISPELTFDAGGVIPVSFTAYLNGEDSTITRNVTINENDLQIDVVSDTTVCASAFPGFSLGEVKLTGGTGNEQLVWSTGYVGTNPTFDSTGTYYVVAQGMDGCKAYASVNIKICQEEKKVGNIWFFGDRAGIDFNPEEPTAIPDSSVMNAPAGASAISDRNGRILFYTDGQTVWNRENEVMQNGDDIGGDPLASQSSLIVPFPGDATLYYIFTTGVVSGSQGSNLQYSIVDMKGDNTFGTVESTSKGTTLPFSSTEKITAVEAGDTTWLLVHGANNNNTFRAYPISSGGIGQPVDSEAGTAHASGKGYMKFSSDGSRVAAAVPASPGFVEIFNFDDSSGVVSDPIKFEFPNEAPYGVEFSPDNEKLYISTSSGLYQYHVNDTLTTEEVIASKKPLDTGGASNLGALQLGPNGQIYLAVDGSTDLLVLNGPNTLETDTSHVSISPFSLLSPDKPESNVTSRLGFPNFVQSIMEPLSDGDFDFQGQCFGDQTEFSAVERCDTDKFSWRILDASNKVLFNQAESDEPEAYFEFPAPGIYSVSLTLSNPCAIPADTTITKEVEIFAPPADPEFPEVIGLCQGDTLLTAGPATAEFEYYWSTGEFTNEIRVDRPGNFSVLIVNTVTGCSETYATTVEFTVPEIDLGPDLILCQGDTPARLDAGEGGSSFVWTINGVAAKTTRHQEVATDVPGEFLYKAIKTGPLGCEVMDSVMVTINALPTFDATPNAALNCGMPEGSISLTNNGLAGNYSFLWSTGATTQDISNLVAGLYNVTVTDETTGCVQVINNIEVEDNNAGFTISVNPPNDASCDNPNGSVSFQINDPVVFPIDYEIKDESGNVYKLGNNITAAPPGLNSFEVTDLLSGSYSITVTSDVGCVQNAEFQIGEPRQVDLQVVDFVEACGDINNGIALIATSNDDPAVTYTWTGPGIIASPNNFTIGVNLAGLYTVTASSPGLCDSTRTVEVELNPAPVASITASGDACDGQYTLTAEDPSSGSSANSYQWRRGTDIVGNMRTITVSESGTYTVEIFRPGCSDLSDPVTIEVFEKPTVSISYDAACSQDEPFTLFANATPANVKYTWYYPNGNVIPGQGADSVQVRDDGTYKVIVENGTCSAEAEVTVARQGVGVSTLPEGEVIICPSSSDPRRADVSLNADSTNAFVKYRWEVDEQFVSSEKIIRPTVPGLYSVTMTNINGCIVEDEVRVVLVCKPIVFVPNAIRPGSGIDQNKTFKIFTEDNISDDEFQVYIFNRWGEMIFQSRDKNFEWDGTFNGNPVPVATYSYVIYYKGAEDPENEVHELKGGVTVLR